MYHEIKRKVDVLYYGYFAAPVERENIMNIFLRENKMDKNFKTTYLSNMTTNRTNIQ